MALPQGVADDSGREAPASIERSLRSILDKFADGSTTLSLPARRPWAQAYYDDRIKTVSKPHLRQGLGMLTERRADSPSC